MSETKVGIRELRINLTQYLSRVRQGAAMLITSHGTVIAELRPPPVTFHPTRQPGALRGQIIMADDFDTLPADISDAMEH